MRLALLFQITLTAITVVIGVSEHYAIGIVPFLMPFAVLGCLSAPVFPLLVFMMGRLPDVPARHRFFAVLASVCLSLTEFVALLPAVQ